MKRMNVAGAVLATAVALTFTGSGSNAADAPSPSAQAAQIKCLGCECVQRAERLQDRQNDCQGKNSCKGKGYVITTDAKSCEGKGGHVRKKAPMNANSQISNWRGS